MIRPAILQPSREQSLISSIRIHHPNRRHGACLGATKNNLLPVRRFTGAEIPDRRFAARELRDGAVARIEPANLRATSGEFRFEVAVEMISVRALRLEFPRHF